METVKFLNKSELKKISLKDLEKLWDSSQLFHESIENEYYSREQSRINQIKKEIIQDERKGLINHS